MVVGGDVGGVVVGGGDVGGVVVGAAGACVTGVCVGVVACGAWVVGVVVAAAGAVVDVDGTAPVAAVAGMPLFSTTKNLFPTP